MNATRAHSVDKKIKPSIATDAHVVWPEKARSVRTVQVCAAASSVEAASRTHTRRFPRPGSNVRWARWSMVLLVRELKEVFTAN